MRRDVLTLLLLLLAGCQPNHSPTTNTAGKDDPAVARSQALSSSETPVKVESKREALAPGDKSSVGPVALKLTAGDAKSLIAPRYSPPGKGLKLEKAEVPAELGFDGLQTEVVLGAPVDNQAPLKLLVTRATADAAYSNLYIDSDGNGRFDEPAIAARVMQARGKIFSNFEATLKVNYPGEANVTEAYPVAFWLTVPTATDQPDVLRMSRRGYKVGEATVGGDKAIVVLSDANNDAVFGEGDWWELRTEDDQESKPVMRRVGEFAWLGESAYMLEIENAFGGAARLVPFDPGITREADALARDPHAADRTAIKAAKPLEFRHDVDAAMAEAAAKQIPCFIKFETTWCGPCKLMTQNVFTAKDVVDASVGLMCIVVDGDERKDLVERYQVKAYPTGLIVLPEGAEAKRFVGYQKVTQMTAFLKERAKK